MTPTKVFPLSTNQLVGWYQSQVYPDSPAYLWHLPTGVRISGDLDVDILKKCLAALIARHEIVRTTFETSLLGQPRQRVHAATACPLACFDLRGHRTPEGTLRNLLVELAKTPFALGEAPPWRISLMRLDEKEHLFFLAIHHIISDAWSQAVFFRQLSALYQAFCRNLPDPLPPPRAQYGDYVTWQRQRLRSDAMEKKLRYWEQQLESPPDFLPGLADFARTPIPRFGGRIETFRIPRELVDQVGRVGHDLGVTPFAVLLANLYLALYRRTRQQNLTVSVPVANRARGIFKEVIGCFAKNLPLRLEVEDDSTFAELAAQAHRTTRSGLANQEAPFVKVMERLKRRDTRYLEAMHQVVFIFQNAFRLQEETDELNFRLEMMWDLLELARQDIVLQLVRTTEGLEGCLEYRTALFTPSTIAALIADYLLLLGENTGDPHRRLAALPTARDDS